MPVPFSLDDVVLPAEDANKPAELPKDEAPADPNPPENPEATEEPVVEEKTEDNKETADSDDSPEEKQPEEKSDDEQGKSGEDDPTPEADEAPPVEEPAKDTKSQDNDDNLPFHKHPEWQKMQQETRAANRRAELAELHNQGYQDKYSDLKSPEEIAEKMVLEAKNAGKEFTDQLELNKFYTGKVREAEKLIAQRQERENRITTINIEQKLDDLKVVGDEDRKKVTDLVVSWAQSGKQVSFESFEVAAEQLKIKGEIGKPRVDGKQKEANPVVNDAPPTPRKEPSEKKKAQDKVNTKIARGKGSGAESAGSKPKISYNDLHKKDLDTIVLEQAQALG